MTRTNRLVVAVTGIVLTVVVAGCGLVGAPGGSGGPDSGSANGGTEQQDGNSQQAGATSSAPPRINVMTAPAIASGTITYYGDQVDVYLVGLRRTSERLVRLDLRASAKHETSFGLGAYFGSDYPTDYAVDAISLLDADAGKRYMVVHDSEDGCLCSEPSSPLGADVPAAVYAYFPAPPPSVERVDVLIPNMEPLRGIPISG